MAKAIDDYRLVVSGLMGNVYMAKLTKTPHVMSSSRRLVPKSEFIDALLQWTIAAQIDENDKDTVQITLDGKVVAEIQIKDRSLIK